MPDPENNDIVEDNVNEETNEEHSDDQGNDETSSDNVHQDVPEPEKKSLFDKFRDIAGLNKSDPEPEPVEVPEGFTNAAKEQGWTDEQIQEFAKDYDEKQLEELIPALLEKEEEPEGEEQEDEQEENKEEQQEEKSDDSDSELLERIALLESKLKEVTEETSLSKEEREQQEALRVFKTVDNAFDQASKDFPELSTTDKLPRFPDGRVVPTSEAYKARQSVWEVANSFMQLGRNADDSMKMALQWYAGGKESKVRDKVIKELKTHESRLSPKRTTRKMDGIKADFNSEAWKAEVVRQAIEKSNKS